MQFKNYPLCVSDRWVQTLNEMKLKNLEMTNVRQKQNKSIHKYICLFQRIEIGYCLIVNYSEYQQIFIVKSLEGDQKRKLKRKNTYTKCHSKRVSIEVKTNERRLKQLKLIIFNNILAWHFNQRCISIIWFLLLLLSKGYSNESSFFS